MNGATRYTRPGFIGALLAGALIAACSAPGPARKPARMEVQAEVGFVITEEARISSSARADYDEAMHLLSVDRNGEGIALLAQAAEEAPEVTAPRIDLGIAHHRVGDLPAAEKQLLKALEINPDHPVAHNELGIVYRRTGRFVEARRSYEAALAIYPGFHFARRNLAVLCDLYLADLSCAREQYEAYLRTAPEDEEVQMWLADVRGRLEQ